MKRRLGNYGPDIFFRKLRKIIRYTIMNIFSSLLLGIGAGMLYLYLSLPDDTWSKIPAYVEAIFRFKLHHQRASQSIVLEIERFVKSQTGLYHSSINLAKLVSATSFVGLGFIFWKVGKQHQDEEHIRGARIISPKELTHRLLKRARFGFLNGFKLGGISIPEEYIWRSLGIVGQPGTGKSNTVRTKMKQDLRRKGKVKYFIIDINGDYWRRFGRPGKDKILSLRHKDSEYWDFKSEDVAPSLLASYLVPKSHSGPSFWWKGARAVLTALLELCPNLDALKSTLASTDGEILELLEVNGALAAKIIGKEGSQQAAGILGNTVIDFSFIRDLGYWPKEKGHKHPFSITNWATATDDDSWVYVIVRDDELEEVRPLIACWFNLAINGCFRRDEAKAYKGFYPSIRIVLDELKTLGKLEELGKAGERLRKYRASLITGYQNDAQLDEIYGKEGAKNIKDVIANRIIYAVGDPDSQESLSIFLGEAEIEESNANEVYNKKDADGHTQSLTIKRKRLVLPSELGLLPDNHCYIKIGGFNPTKTVIEYVPFDLKNPEPEWEIPPRNRRSPSPKNDSAAGDAISYGSETDLNEETSKAPEAAQAGEDIWKEDRTESQQVEGVDANDIRLRAEDIFRSMDYQEDEEY